MALNESVRPFSLQNWRMILMTLRERKASASVLTHIAS